MTRHEHLTTKIATIDGIAHYELSPVLRHIKQAGAINAGDRLTDPPARTPRARRTAAG